MSGQVVTGKRRRKQHATSPPAAHAKAVGRGGNSEDTGAACVVEPALRSRMIAEAAYFRAERRGFGNGDPVQDWLEAEIEIDRVLNSQFR